MDLVEITVDITSALVEIDKSGVPFRSFQPGVGPYGDPQLVKLIAAHLNVIPSYNGRVVTKRTPDLLIPGQWAIEFKIARPFGDNGQEAENWSVNLLHPYPGSVSTIGDCLKLAGLSIPERKAVAVIGYEHAPPRIDLTPLVESFESIARDVVKLSLSARIEIKRDGLIHSVHQSVRVVTWEVLPFQGEEREATKHK